MFSRFPHQRREILDLLRHHVPVPRHTVKKQVALRWVITLGMVGLLPLAISMTAAPHRFLEVSGWVVGALAGLGVLAIFISILARQKHGLNRQWGLASLTTAQTIELTDLSGQDPDVSAIVDEWVERWIGAKAHLIGLDLILLRHAMEALKKSERPHSTMVSQSSLTNSNY